jgi:hypothetical protein
MTTTGMDYGNKKRSNEKSSPSSSDHLNGNIVARRTRIPNKPNYHLSLWNILKNCIGKDLTKIPLPVNFSEPLSVLQR